MTFKLKKQLKINQISLLIRKDKLLSNDIQAKKQLKINQISLLIWKDKLLPKL